MQTETPLPLELSNLKIGEFFEACNRHVHKQIEHGGCRWNQEPQELVREAGIKILHADRALLGIFHSITASPAKEN